MYKKISLILICAWLLGSGFAFAQDANTESEEKRPPVPELDLPFPIGEKLTYEIYWGWIGVGTSEAKTFWRWEEEKEEWELVIQFRTRSNSVLSSLYPVDDIIETVLDPVTLKPRHFKVDIKEGDTVRNEITVFDWQKMEAYFTKFHDDKDDEKVTIALQENTRDLVSFMYFMRETPFISGKEYDFDVLTDAKIYDLKVSAKKSEDIKLETYGKTKSLKLSPTAQFQGIFVRKGKMELWVSEDSRRIMTKMFVDTPFANVRVLLKSVEGPGEDEWVKDSEKKGE
jgi:hypothetical protein